MKRRTPLKPGKPLKRRKPLKQTQTPMRRTVMVRTEMKQRPRRRSTTHLRKSLPGRSGGWCELQIVCVCAERATGPAHRNGTKIGGRHGDGIITNDRASNVMDACWPCNQWPLQAGNRQQAEDNGWVLREGDNPLTKPVLYRGQWVRLDDEWNVTPCAPPPGRSSP